MKKIVGFLFVLCMIFLLSGEDVYAANATINLSTNKKSVDVNDVIEVCIDIESEIDIKYVKAAISYDTEMLEFVTSSQTISKENGYLKLEDKECLMGIPRLPEKKVDKIYEIFHKNAKENGYVKTLYGRKRVIDEINNTNFMIRQTGERMAINTPIQGAAADIIKMAMIKVKNEFIKNNIESKLILQVHDELIFDVKKDELDKNAMESVVELSVPLKVSQDTGVNWYETK